VTTYEPIGVKSITNGSARGGVCGVRGFLKRPVCCVIRVVSGAIAIMQRNFVVGIGSVSIVDGRVYSVEIEMKIPVGIVARR